MVLWQDIAEALRTGIARGDYPAGSTIPKETELMAAHGTGRDPVRRAIAQLTAEGLVEPVRRRGTVVRHHPPRRRITRSRLVYRDELGYYFDRTAQNWRPVQPPSVFRGPVPYDIAAMLGLEPGGEVIVRDRIMGDPATRQAIQLATSYIPAGLAGELPVLSAAETGPGGIYDRLEDAGYGPLRWAEAITSRMPGPAEARLLQLPPGVPLLRIVRLAASPSGQPLEVNDTRFNAEDWEISYPISRHRSARPGHNSEAEDAPYRVPGH